MRIPLRPSTFVCNPQNIRACIVWIGAFAISCCVGSIAIMSFVRFLSWVLPALGIVVLFIGETSALNLIINLNSWFVPIGMQIAQSWADNVIVYIFYAILLLLILGPLFLAYPVNAHDRYM